MCIVLFMSRFNGKKINNALTPVFFNFDTWFPVDISLQFILIVIIMCNHY